MVNAFLIGCMSLLGICADISVETRGCTGSVAAGGRFDVITGRSSTCRDGRTSVRATNPVGPFEYVGQQPVEDGEIHD
jgi:hypothetical protein